MASQQTGWCADVAVLGCKAVRDCHTCHLVLHPGVRRLFATQSLDGRSPFLWSIIWNQNLEMMS